MVFLYVRGADNRADEKFDADPGARAPGRRSTRARLADAPRPPARSRLETVADGQVLDGYATDLRRSLSGTVALDHDLPRRADHHRQVRQPTAEASRRSPIPDGKIAISVEPRPTRPGRRLRQPGRRGRDLPDHGSDRGRPSAGVPRLAAATGQGDRRRHDHRRVDHRPPTSRRRRPPSSCPGRC